MILKLCEFVNLNFVIQFLTEHPNRLKAVLFDENCPPEVRRLCKLVLLHSIRIAMMNEFDHLHIFDLLDDASSDDDHLETEFYELRHRNWNFIEDDAEYLNNYVDRLDGTSDQ